jgi:hypothetical protein
MPDISSGRRRLAGALFVTLVVAVVLAIRMPIHARYGDTDDAMRLVMVRDLLAGRGWYDQLVTRLAPPQGVYMHWSRLVDGGLAGAMTLARLVAPPATAEWLVRLIWPLAWIFPAAVATLTIARNIGGRYAVVLTALLLCFDLGLYEQFVPGRIDHHNLQIVMALIALAGATSRAQERRGAIVAGLAGAFGLGVGLEALLLHGLIGAYYAFRLAEDRRKASVTAAYGASLSLACLAIFLVQTPPWRWPLSFCDALALNSVAAVLVAGAGLVLSAALASRVSPVPRVGLLAGAAAAAIGIYLVLDPNCLHGPFAEVSPVARRLWLDRVAEVQPVTHIIKFNRAAATSELAFLIVSAGASLFILFTQERTVARGLVLVALALATLVGLMAWRMTSYAFWIAMPVLGAAFAAFAQRRLRGLLLPSAFVTFLFAPGPIGQAAIVTENLVRPNKAEAVAEASQAACFAPRAFRQLASLPAGRVLADIDLGSFILLFTPHSALSAPYHRAWAMILKAHDAFDGPPGVAEGRARALGADYIVDCAGLPLMGGASGLAVRLRAGETPAWLREVSPPGATLRIYEVARR